MSRRAREVRTTSIEDIADELTEARRRTLDLIGALSHDDLVTQHSPLMSPMVWDLAHIVNYEEQWLVREVGGVAPVDPALDDLYDAFEHPRSTRAALPILDPDAALAYGERVAVAVREVLVNDGIDLSPNAADPLTRNGFVYGMVLQHEHQHNETLLATLQLMGEKSILPPGTSIPAVAPAEVGSSTTATAIPAEVLVDGGPFTMGTSREHTPWAYDNEVDAHVVDLPPYFIDTTPVTNRAFAAFIADGGYNDERLWSPAGWAWRHEAGLGAPGFWRHDDGDEATAVGADGTLDRWRVLRFGQWLDLASIADEPVQHVCFHEADAYARWTGRRLPTEAEWEKAATWDPASGRKRRYPWGDAPPTSEHASLWPGLAGPRPVGSFPGGASAYGVLGMIGDVWEWTSSAFQPYPGFSPFPYQEYSEVFWGDEHRVLRGGSWAVHPMAIRGTFRNWDYPIRRQIFSGFRCARDAV